MKIGFLNPWQDAAENQCFQSLAIAAARIGHELVHCANSMEVAAHAPSFVLACSSIQPKLNDTPHYAVIHAHRDLYLTERSHYDNILTCDGYLTISDSLARFIRDLTFGAGRPQEAGFYFITCQRLDIRTDLPTLIASSRLKITYCGTNWDTDRAVLVALLSRHEGVEVFGPEHSWTGLDRKAYGGRLPFDGVSVQKKYAENGIGLCLLSDEHYRDDIISNRVFEVASVGAIAICPDIPWLRRNFGDYLYYIDQSFPTTTSCGRSSCGARRSTETPVPRSKGPVARGRFSSVISPPRSCWGTPSPTTTACPPSGKRLSPSAPNTPR